MYVCKIFSIHLKRLIMYINIKKCVIIRDGSILILVSGMGPILWLITCTPTHKTAPILLQHPILILCDVMILSLWCKHKGIRKLGVGKRTYETVTSVLRALSTVICKLLCMQASCKLPCKSSCNSQHLALIFNTTLRLAALVLSIKHKPLNKHHKILNIKLSIMSSLLAAHSSNQPINCSVTSMIA